MGVKKDPYLIEDRGYTVPKIFTVLTAGEMKQSLHHYSQLISDIEAGKLKRPEETKEAFMQYKGWFEQRLKEIELTKLLTK
ncbi:hypothetical protein [Marinobacterium litorale]|uniref:hypothetical protein n=1 Tax=Marinobacterium litorale TaxID=404770 RepID=UPI000487C800|nr:hypothetical protein [Marinobacterium litorale]